LKENNKENLKFLLFNKKSSLIKSENQHFSSAFAKGTALLKEKLQKSDNVATFDAKGELNESQNQDLSINRSQNIYDSEVSHIRYSSNNPEISKF
jgi:hypothetical protein